MKNLPLSKVESFVKSNYDLKQTYKRQEKSFAGMKKVKKKSSEEIGSSYDQKFVCSHNPGENIWNKVQKSSKIRQDQKTLVSIFVYFLTTIAKVQFLEGRLGPRLSLSKLEIFLIFPNLLRF